MERAGGLRESERVLEKVRPGMNGSLGRGGGVSCTVEGVWDSNRQGAKSMQLWVFVPMLRFIWMLCNLGQIL